jgi:hypothetical protein
MPVITLILLGSILLLPAAALLSLRWASRSGQLGRFDRAALLPFDEEGRATDQILGDNRR